MKKKKNNNKYKLFNICKKKKNFFQQKKINSYIPYLHEAIARAISCDSLQLLIRTKSDINNA